MRDLSRMQAKVFERLKAHVARYGAVPSASELARELGMHYVSLKQHLVALDKKGYLHFQSRGRGKAPSLELPVQATGVPVVGEIPAGPLSEALAHPDGYLPLQPGRGIHFALRVSGDSMADLIQDGDLVLLKKESPARSGLICAVRVEENEVTLKYLLWQNAKTIVLKPHNPDYPTLNVPASELHIEGVYQGLVRGALVDVLYHDQEV